MRLDSPLPDAAQSALQQQTEKERAQRRKLLFALLGMLIADAETRLHTLAGQVAAPSSTLDVDDFHRAALNYLMGAHAMAAYLGRQLAGVREPMGELDAHFGNVAAHDENVYLAGFVEDIRAGKYRQLEAGQGEAAQDAAAIERRALLYAGALRATANEAWCLSLPPGTQIWWRTGAPEDHCRKCPEMAANSPYLSENMRIFPGSSELPCGHNCKCTLEAEGFGEGF